MEEMNGILLKDEEIVAAVEKDCNMGIEVADSDRAIAKAQAKKLVEWLKEIGIGEGPVGSDPVWLKLPWKFWLDLRREVLGE